MGERDSPSLPVKWIDLNVSRSEFLKALEERFGVDLEDAGTAEHMALKYNMTVGDIVLALTKRLPVVERDPALPCQTLVIFLALRRVLGTMFDLRTVQPHALMSTFGNPRRLENDVFELLDQNNLSTGLVTDTYVNTFSFLLVLGFLAGFVIISNLQNIFYISMSSITETILTLVLYAVLILGWVYLFALSRKGKTSSKRAFDKTITVFDYAQQTALRQFRPYLEKHGRVRKAMLIASLMDLIRLNCGKKEDMDCQTKLIFFDP